MKNIYIMRNVSCAKTQLSSTFAQILLSPFTLEVMKLFFHHWVLSVTWRSKQQWNITWARVIKTVISMANWGQTGPECHPNDRVCWGLGEERRGGGLLKPPTIIHQTALVDSPLLPFIHPPPTTLLSPLCAGNSLVPWPHETHKTVVLPYKATDI